MEEKTFLTKPICPQHLSMICSLTRVAFQPVPILILMGWYMLSLKLLSITTWLPLLMGWHWLSDVLVDGNVNNSQKSEVRSKSHCLNSWRLSFPICKKIRIIILPLRVVKKKNVWLFWQYGGCFYYFFLRQLLVSLREVKFLDHILCARHSLHKLPHLIPISALCNGINILVQNGTIICSRSLGPKGYITPAVSPDQILS